MTQGARKGSDWALRLWMSMIFKTVGPQPQRALLQPGFEDDLHVNSPKSTTTGGTHPCQVKPLAQFQDMCIILQKRSTASVNSKHGQWMEIPSFGCSQESAVFFFHRGYQNIKICYSEKFEKQNVQTSTWHIGHIGHHGWDQPIGASSPVLPWDCPSAAPFPNRWPGAWALCDSRRASTRIGWWRMVWGGIDDINLAWLVEILMINGLWSSPVFWVVKHSKTV